MVLTPQMAISPLVMTIGVGISQNKISKIVTPSDDVQILWNNPDTKHWFGKDYLFGKYKRIKLNLVVHSYIMAIS